MPRRSGISPIDAPRRVDTKRLCNPWGAPGGLRPEPNVRSTRRSATWFQWESKLKQIRNPDQLPQPRSHAYNLRLRDPGQAGLVGFIEPLLNSAPIFTDVEGRTEGDYGLEFQRTSNINHVFNGVAVVEEVFWGVPADPSPTTRLRLQPAGLHSLRGKWKAPSMRRGRSFPTLPLRPFINAPTICGVRHSITEALCRVLRPRLQSGNGELTRRTTGCDQLSGSIRVCSPSRRRDRADTASGARHRPQGPNRPKALSPPAPSAIKVRER